MTSKDEKEVKRLLKEKDKLERDALVARMQAKDKTKERKIAGMVDNP